MAAALQIFTLVASFALALLLGTIFDTAYFQAAIVAKEQLGDQALPAITLLLSQNHRALIYVMMIPWIGFAGIPAFAGNGDYLDGISFLIRFAAFLAIEALVTVFLLLFLILPFVPYYLLMDMRPNTVAETIVIFGFWILVATILAFIFRNRAFNREAPQAEQDGERKPDHVSS